MIVRPQQHWLRRIFVWHGSVLSKISSRLLLNFLFSIAVIFMLPWYTHLGIKFTLAPFSILGVAIAIFLGFRNNAGYARYVEARKLWGQLMIASRSLLREVKTTLPDSASVREFARLQIAFAHCLRMTLRKQPQAEVLAHYLKTEDLQRVLASNSPANRILLIMGEWLAVQRRNGQLSDILFISLNDRLNDISAVLAGCERIAYTPISLCLHPDFASYRLSVLYHAAVRAGRGPALHDAFYLCADFLHFYFAGLSGGRTGRSVRY